MSDTQTAAPRSVPSPAQMPQQARVKAPIEVTGAQSLVLSLEAMEVDTVFGIPGGAILPAYDPLLDSVKVRHILVRHEQGAGHAAEGYAAATGKVGVCMATSGPGATNLVTAIADAYMDSVPIVAITGQVTSTSIGTDAFQEADIRGITMPITKHNYLVTDPADIPRIDRRGVPHRRAPAARARCSSTSPRTPSRRGRPSRGRRGSTCRATARSPARTASRSARPPGSSPRRERPVLYVGGGVIRAPGQRRSCAGSPSSPRSPS